MGKGVVIFLVIFLIGFIQAESIHNLQVDGEDYVIELISASDGSAIIKVNNETQEISSEQTSPYQFPGVGYKEIGGLQVILANADENTALSSMNVSLFTGFEKNFFINGTYSDDTALLVIDGDNYTIQLLGATGDSASIKVNSETKQISTEQTSPYKFPLGYGYKEIGGPHIILKYAAISEALGYENASVFIFTEQNFFLIEGCVETWSCTNWSTCSSNQQTRSCIDVNDCGTNTSKPSENQSCSINPGNPTIECYSDEECMLDATGQPYCEGSNLCIPSLSYKCINNGTASSYCNSTSVKDCSVCSNGCSVDHCINSSSRECEPIGLREDGKYCSSQYAFVDQKDEGVSCENNFECTSNICANSLCAKEKPSYKVYWIVGTILVVIIIAYLIFRPKKVAYMDMTANP